MADAQAIIDNAQGFAADAAREANAALLEVRNAIIAAPFPSEFTASVDLEGLIESLATTAEELISDLVEASEFQEELAEPDGGPPIVDPLDDIPEASIQTEFGDAPGISTKGLFKTQLPGGFAEDPPTEPPGIDATFPPITEPTINSIGEPNLIKIGDDLNTYQVPTYQQINPFPIFNEEGPGTPPDPPERVLERYEEAYRRMVPEMKAFVDGCMQTFLDRFDVNHIAHMENLNDRIDQYLEGGSGFNEQVEQAIYDRGRGRVHAENRATEQTAWDQIAQKGYTMPQGALVREVRRSHGEAANRNGALAMDIVKLQGELEQKNLQFAMAQSIALRTSIRNASIQYATALLQVNRDALQYAQQFVDAVIKVYELQVTAWQSSIEYLRARISLYEARLRAALADVEIFKAEIEALGLITEVNKNKVEVFQQQIELEKTKVELFAEKIRVQSVEIGRRQALVSIYQGLVQSYSAKVQAKSAEFSAFSAAIDGDKAALQAQVAAIDGYRAKVEGISVANQAALTVSTAKAENNRAIVDKFRAEMDGFIQQYRANQIEFEGKVQIKDQEIRAFGVMAQNQISQRSLVTDYHKSIVQANAALVSAEAQAHVGTMNGRAAEATATVEGAASAAKTAASIATGALSAQNTLVQVADITQN